MSTDEFVYLAHSAYGPRFVRSSPHEIVQPSLHLDRPALMAGV